MCPKCVKCKSCGTTSPASSTGVLWNFDLLLCQPCAKLTDKGNYCPVCHKCYEENDYESKMVQCYKCNRWVHATCDNITDEGYEILSCLPETVVYTCIVCTVETTPLWKKAIKEYLKHGLKSVLNSLLTARCARHLIRQVDASSSYQKTPTSQLESNKTTDLDKPNFISHNQTDLQSDKNNSLNSEDKCDRIAVAETVSSLVDTVHLHSSDEEKVGDPLQNCSGLKNISTKEICDVENNTLQSSMKDSTYPNNKDFQKCPDPDLLVVKANLDKGKYKTIASFFDDVIEIIESGNDMGMKHHTSASKAVLIKQTEKIFPWFKVPSAKIWKSKCDLPEGMLPNAVLPPSLDHTYARYLERITIFPPLNLKSEPPPPDCRSCVLCNYSGDSQPKKCGRLLYCGQDEWIHVNCAMWSAEVFQQQDGSLRNVHPAISRGRLMHCEFCNQLGATVGCCVRGCPANYHFYCARKDEAILQADKKVFCALHRESVDERVLSEKDFPVKERVYVNQASITPKWVKKNWEAPMNKDSLHIVIVGAKDPSGVTESSGYSSNEDNHLRQSIRQPSLPNHPNEMKCNSAGKSARLNIASSWEKGLKFNGQKEFHSNLDVLDKKLCDQEFSSSKNEKKLSNNIVLEKTYSKDKILNGMCQTAGPFKCSKCKRLYRTIESFKKHSDLCNFVIDSSSGDEESDSSMSSEKSSEDDCVVASRKNLEKNREQILDAMDVDEPYPETACNNKFRDNKQTSENTKKLVNGENSVTCLENIYDMNKNTNDQPFKQSQESFVSNNFHSSEHSILNSNDNYSSAPQATNGPVTEQKLRSAVKEDLVPNAVAMNERIIIPPQQSLNSPVGIDCNSLNTQNVISNAPMEINRVPLVAENVPNVFNCGYSNTLCNNPPNNIMPMPCNTLIIPPTPTPVAQSNPVLSQIPMPQGNFIQPSIDLNQSSQLSYVGSITITNNETMSLAVNVPDQIVPIFPQQDLNFSVIPSPIQMPQPAEIHLSTVNVQHISVQSSFSANTVNQLVFPQQAVPFHQGQVMFVEDPVTHHLSPAQPSNYMFQVPIEQTQNCAFTAYLPQQEMQPQFLNQFTFQSSAQQISNQQMNNVFQLQNPVPLPVGNLAQPTEMQRPVNNNPVNILPNSHKFTENSSTRVQLAAKQTPQMIQSAVSPSPPNLSNRSSPASDLSSSGRSCVSAITVPSNSNIVDILKKAAEQMLNIKANMSKKGDKSQSEVPEKKTRFAHTRKVAARKAEKLKQKNAVLNGSNASLTSQIKPKSVKLNIIKPTFSIPFVPIPAPSKTVNIPLPKSEEESPKPPPPLEKTEDTLPQSQPEVPVTLESNSDIYCYDDDESEEESPLVRMHLRQMELEGREESFPKDRPYLLYEIDSEDGLHIQSRNLRDAWLKVYDELQDARIAAHMKQITLAPEDVNGPHMLGLDNPALMYLLEQLPGAECCPDYEFLFHQPAKEIIEIPENATGCARSEGFQGRKESDMFNFLASEHRNRPIFLPPEEEEEGTQKSSRRTNLDLPIAMRFRFLKDVARETVGVYRSSIHGRGLFCKRNIDPGELVIEYAGEVIRSVLTDKRERIYQSKGIGCYMFRIDDDEVVDATMHGNAARFINHSCEPNCFSKVITIDGKKHIVIFALRRIIKGEELTYDYKFPFEDEKIPCHCNSRRCRKYLN
ncbi:unnamed protein product [Larinioides sclopetarius]